MSAATLDNLLAQMRQNQPVLNGWDVVFNLREEPVNQIFQMQFQKAPQGVWKEVEVNYCEVFGSGAQTMAGYTQVRMTLGAPALQLLDNNQNQARVSFSVTGSVRTAGTSVPAGFDPSRDANAADPALKWTSTTLAGESFEGTVPLASVRGGLAGAGDAYAVYLDFSAGSFDGSFFHLVRNADRLCQELRTYFATHGIRYVINQVQTRGVNQLPMLTPSSFRMNVLKTNAGVTLLQLYIATTGSEQPDLSVHVNEPLPDGYDFSLMISRSIVARLGGATGLQVSTAALRNLIFPGGDDVARPSANYTPGDMVVLGTMKLSSIAIVSGNRQATFRQGSQPAGGTARFAPLKVRVTDALGGPRAGATVTFSAGAHPPAMAVQLYPSGAPTTQAVTGADGVATLDAMLGSSVYTYYADGAFGVLASLPSGDSVTFSLQAVPAPAPGKALSVVMLSGDGQTASRQGMMVPGGMARFGPLQVLVLNGQGAPVPGTPVTFAAANHAGAMAVQLQPAGYSTLTVNTGADGVATLDAMSGDSVLVYYQDGPFSIVASAPGADPVTFNLQCVPAPPPSLLPGTRLAPVGGNGQTVARNGGTAKFAPLSVRVVDQDGNPVGNAIVDFTAGAHPSGMAVQVDPSGGEPASAMTGGDGVATLTRMLGYGVWAYYASGNFNVVASVAGGGSTSFSLTAAP